MQFIFDHLVATMVAATLGLTLVTQQTHNRQAALERQAVYHAKGQALAFGEWLEDDIVKLGARFGRERARFLAETETIDGDPYTRSFEFYYHDEVIADSIVKRVEVRYALDEDDDLRVVAEKGATPDQDVVLQTYTLTRSARTGQYNTKARAWLGTQPAWTETAEYGVPRGLRYFAITPKDSFDRPVPDERSEDADYVRIEFVVVPTLFPLHRARLIPKAGLHWATTIEVRPF
ncbi:hypothetical protein [Rubrivirga sp.]|uniref:hypothetical protein n=1 Tax=Rubrivirga sp. TaxID=1885344 RepID=UPI003B52D6F5